MAETIVHVTLDDQDVRCYDIMHRTSKGEKFYPKFNDDGKLEKHIPEAADDAVELPSVWSYSVKTQPGQRS